MGFKKIMATTAVAALALGAMLTGPASATNIGDDEGCTPGYWKNHTSNWQEYSTSSKLANNFTLGDFSTKWGNSTFKDALSFKGGPGLDGAFQILMRASTASFLNAAHEGIGYPLRRFREPFNIQAQVNAALASGDRDAMLALATELDGYNNLGCPLN
jgi:hypothetical protein